MDTHEAIEYILENYNMDELLKLDDKELYSKLSYICNYLQRENDYVARHTSITKNIVITDVINYILKYKHDKHK